MKKIKLIFLLLGTSWLISTGLTLLGCSNFTILLSCMLAGAVLALILPNALE